MDSKPDPNAPVADEAPDGPSITSYDELHFIHYLRLLDANAKGADLHRLSWESIQARSRIGLTAPMRRIWRVRGG
jgi:hypothetical protein